MLGVTAGLLAPLGLISTANAANQDGNPQYKEFNFYYLSNIVGSLSDFENSKSNLSGYAFLSAGSGQGQAVKNNSASVSNNHPTKAVRVYFNSGYVGSYDNVNPITSRNLSVTYNENASFQFQS